MIASFGSLSAAGVVARGGTLGGGASRFPRSCAARPSSSSMVIDDSGGWLDAVRCAGGGVGVVTMLVMVVMVVMIVM